MADVKISALTSAGTLAGTEVLPIVQSSSTVKATVQSVANLAVKSAKLTLSSAQILALNTTPLTIVPSPDAGKINIPLCCYFEYDYNSVAYSTSTNLQVLFSGANSSIAESNILGNTLDVSNFVDCSSVLQSGGSLSNRDIIVRAEASDPTAGNSTATVYIIYKEITL